MQPLSPETHGDKYWQRFSNYHFTARTASVPIVAAELGQAVRTLPLAFARQGNDYVLVAVLSNTPNRNLYLAPNGKWLGGYVPALFRGYPFSLQDGVLHVDEAMVGDQPGESFYDDNGELSPPVKEVLGFLQKLDRNRQDTDRAVAALTTQGLLKEWQSGLMITDEAKLNSLPDELFLKLRQTASLPLAYAQLMSMANFQIFDKLEQMAKQIQAQQPAPAAAFSLDDDMIRFD